MSSINSTPEDLTYDSAPLRSAYNNDGKKIGLLGGDGSIQLFNSFPQAHSVVIFGDSITENNVYINSNSIAYGQRGYLTWANILLSNKRLFLANNAGVSGETTEQMLDRIEEDVLDYNPSVVVINGGINDLAGNLLGYEVVINNLEEIYKILLDRGIKVVMCSIMPVTSAHSQWNLQLFNRICSVNKWMQDYAAETPGTIFCNFFQGVIDPTDTSGNPKSGYFHDTIHPSAIGAYNLGVALSNVLTDQTGESLPLLASVADDWSSDAMTITTLTGDGKVITCTRTSHNRKVGDRIMIVGATPSFINGEHEVLSVVSSSIFTIDGSFIGTATGTIVMSQSLTLTDEGLFQGNGGVAGTGVTGDVATGWTVQREVGTPTASCTVDARSDGIGNDQTMVISGGANADMMTLQSTDVPGRVIAGQTFYAECAIDVSSITNMNLCQLFLDTIDNGSTKGRFDGGHADFTDAYPTTNYSGILRTPTLTLVGPCTRLRIKVRVRFNGVGGATVKVGRARIVKVLS